MNELLTIMPRIILAHGILYLIYRFMISRSDNFTLNRLLILALIMVPFPFFMLMDQVSQASVPSFMLPVINAGNTVIDQAVNRTVNFRNLITIIYATGCILLTFRLIYSLAGIRLLIKRTSFTRTGNGIKIHEVDKPGIAFSFQKNVFISRSFSPEEKQVILEHEKVHALQHHYLDLIFSGFLLVILWPDIFLWLFRKELILNHEFSADKHAETHFGRDVYRHTLLAGTMHTSAHHFASRFMNSLNLKTRILMLNKKNQKFRGLFNYATFTAATAITLFVISCKDKTVLQPEPEMQKVPVYVQGKIVDSAYIPANQPKAPGVEMMPHFPGGEEKLMAYLSESIKYPASAKSEGIEGTVFVNFIVDENGKIRDARILQKVNPVLEAEALRVVKSMPDWTPAVKDGSPVSIQFTLPVRFTLGK